MAKNIFFSLIAESININYPLHPEVNKLTIFLPNWVVLIILQLKSTQIWEIGRTITW